MQRKRRSAEAKTEVKKPPQPLEHDRGMMDVPYLLLTLLLTAVGLIMLFSASFARSYYLTGNSASYFTSQLVFALIGVGVLYLMSRVPYAWYEKTALFIYGAAFLLLVAVLVVGTRVNGAKRWINLGFTGLQPSELAKFALVVMLAAVLSRFQRESKKPKVFWICAGLLGFVVLWL